MLGLLLESAALDVFGQMALDEALAASRPEGFTLRIYRWKGVGATFGYAQRFLDVQKALPAAIGTAHARRPTGGGVVAHLDDLTFSCVFPAEGERRPAEIYRRLHAALLAGLRGAGLEAHVCVHGGSAAPHGPGGAAQCFVEPVAQDIRAAGRKSRRRDGALPGVAAASGGAGAGGLGTGGDGGVGGSVRIAVAAQGSADGGARGGAGVGIEAPLGGLDPPAVNPAGISRTVFCGGAVWGRRRVR